MEDSALNVQGPWRTLLPRRWRDRGAAVRRRVAAIHGRIVRSVSIACLVSLASAGAQAQPSQTTQSSQPSLALVPGRIPAFDELRALSPGSDALLYDRHGELMHQVRIDFSQRQWPWVALDDVSPAMVQALLVSEDRRFFDHGGVDWRSLAAAGLRGAIQAAGSGQVRRSGGASTLSMQLVGLLDARLARSGQGRSTAEKLAQMEAALRLERLWRKDQILEAYLNLVPLRGEWRGVAAMTHAAWGKRPSGLDRSEAALVAALIRAPNAAREPWVRRACDILWQTARSIDSPQADCERARMLAEGLTRARKADTAAATSANVGPRAHPAAMGPWLAPQLIPHLAAKLVPASEANSSGETATISDAAIGPIPARPGRITTTLDARLQRIALDAMRRQMQSLHGRDADDAAVIVLDNRSGEIRAWVGASASTSQAPHVDAVIARRQAGSTLKPFVYGAALQRRVLTAASLLDDSPMELPAGAGAYVPRNYAASYQGPVSVRRALGSSLNLPAIRSIVLTGVEPVYQTLQQVGFTLPQPAGFYGYSLALGSADVSLLELANAYRTLANGGQFAPVAPWVKARPIAESAPNGQQRSAHAKPSTQAAGAAMDPAVAYIITDMLRDNSARSLTFGLDSALATRVGAAVKTGTSKDMRDNWCVGYTREHTVAVWVGNAAGLPMRAVSGVTGAAPIWQELIHALGKAQPERGVEHVSTLALQESASTPQESAAQALLPQTLASQLRAVPVVFEGTREAPRTELFLAGTERDRVTALRPIASFGAKSGMSNVVTPGTTRDTTKPQSELAARIVHPLRDVVIALDPDIPVKAQRLLLRAEGRDLPTLSWRINGRPVAGASWFPVPGRHTVALVQADGQVVDQLRIEVRQPPVRKQARRSP